MSVRCLTSVKRDSGIAICAITGLLTFLGLQPVLAIDVNLSVEEAQKILEAGRAPMEKANTPEERQEGPSASFSGYARGSRPGERSLWSQCHPQDEALST